MTAWCITLIPPMLADWTASGACTSGSIAFPWDETRTASGGTATTSMTKARQSRDQGAMRTGPKEPIEFMHHCSTKWGIFLMSLKSILETGKGAPYPNDVKIDNWN